MMYILGSVSFESAKPRPIHLGVARVGPRNEGKMSRSIHTDSSINNSKHSSLLTWGLDS